MGLFGKFFSATWWNGATFGTALFSGRNGSQVGKDADGNLYYQHKNGEDVRRWVIYSGANDGSRVPPVWQAWLKGTIDDLPDRIEPPRRPFEQPPSPNLTGTPAAYRPSGSMGGSGRRAAATGDYQAWTPE